MTVEISDGPEATEALGAKIAAALAPGDVVLVSGELGSGKTTLVRGACRALGVEGPVVSPTFTIGRRYRAARGPVSHLDLYRLDGVGGEEPGLLDDYLDAGSITFVEWPELAPDLELADGVRIARRVVLRHAGANRREVELGDPAPVQGA